VTVARDVVCLGIVVADVVARPVSELPERGTLGLLDEISLRGGGCALNTASALRRFGLDVAVAGKVGDDAFGEFLLALLDERGIDRTAVVRDVVAPTSATVVLVAPDGEQTFLHRLGSSGALRAGEFAPEQVLAARALHVAGALVMPALDGEPTAALLREARSRGVLTSLDTAFDASGRWWRIDDVLPHVDLFTASVAETRAITGESEPRQMAAWLRRAGAREVAVKLGPEGCYAAGEGFEGHVPAADVAAVDGTGAGDAFAAGLLYGRLAGWAFEHAVRFANAAGALATTTVGASDGVYGLDETLALAGLEAGRVATPAGRRA
jgi:sugar/nucleoside kinase (ribokinase family)